MSHEIHASDRFGEVRAQGKRAWHGLGEEIPVGQTAEEGFEKIGLGWRTILAPMYAEVESLGSDSNGNPLMMKTRIEVPEKRAQFRADTMELLGVVSDNYQSLENMDLARFADALVDAEDGKVTVETAGSLHSGRRIFACVKLPETVRAGRSNDIMDQYVLVSNGHGGTASFACYPTSVRVVCANTLRWSESDVARGLRFFHLGSMDEKLKNARVALGTARKETAKFQEQVNALVGLPITRELAKELAEDIYMRCFGKPDGSLDAEQVERLMKRKDEVVAKWLMNMDDARQRVAGIEGTGWAFYNAISQWNDHERGYFDGITESNARVSSNLFGASQKSKLKAFRRILAAV